MYRSNHLIVAVAVAVATAASPALFAQAPGPDPTAVEAMRPLHFMVGVWEGEGWIQMGPDRREVFAGREVVELRLDGTVMLIEGIHRSASGEAGEPVVVHHALAVLSPSSDGGYLFRSWLFNREGGEFRGRVEDDAFIWGTTTPRGEMRYTIRLDEQARWHEIGELIGPGGESRQFFEMTLRRTGQPAAGGAQGAGGGLGEVPRRLDPMPTACAQCRPAVGPAGTGQVSGRERSGTRSPRAGSPAGRG